MRPEDSRVYMAFNTSTTTQTKSTYVKAAEKALDSAYSVLENGARANILGLIGSAR